MAVAATAVAARPRLSCSLSAWPLDQESGPQMRRVSLKQLIRHVDVEPLEALGHFLGRSVDLGWGRIYGGRKCCKDSKSPL